MSSDLHRTRLKNLNLLISEAGSATALGRKTKTDGSYFGHVKSGKRRLGEKLCRRIEKSLKLKEGWMDQPH